jgi:hypothetical protein
MGLSWSRQATQDESRRRRGIWAEVDTWKAITRTMLHLLLGQIVKK